MALFKKRNGDSVGVAEAKVSELRERGEALQAQRQRVAAKRDAAVADRKAALLDDDALDKAGFAIASLDAQLSGLDDAVAENQRALADAEAALEFAKVKAAREEKAAALEQKLNRARDAFPKYIAAAQGLAEAMGGTGNFHLEEASALIARVARDVETAREMLFQNGDRAVSQLRADPPPKPAPVTPPPLGPFSPFRKHFAAEDGTAMTDAGPVYCGFPERD